MALTRPLLSQLNTNIIAFSDNMMVINYANVGNRDIGTVYDRSVAGQSNVALIWQESTNSFALIQTSSSGLTNANLTATANANLRAGIITGQTVQSSGEIIASTFLKSLYSAGDEGGEIFLNKPQANTSLSGSGVTIDVYQNKLRIFEDSGTNRGGFFDISALASGVGTNLGAASATPPGGSSGQVQFNNSSSFGGATGFTYTTGNVSVPNLTVNSTMTVSSTLGVTGNLNAVSASFTGNITKGNKNVVTNFTGNSAPSNPQPGDEWYYRPTDTLYKYIYDGNTLNWISLNSALFTANTGAVPSTLALRDSGANLTATNFLGTASSAKYADLAENYVSDGAYQPGTVVVFGGEKEITVTDLSHDTRVAGVISTNPAYLMNSDCDGLPVAFTGRVPCQVKGPVRKGDLLVTSDQPGVAQVLDNSYYKPGCIFGKSLENAIVDDIVTIEVVVGRY